MKSAKPLFLRLAAGVVMTLVGAVLGHEATAAASTVRPQSFAALEAVWHDDPRAAIARAQQQRDQATDAGARFWAHLALARTHDLLERRADAARSIEHARAALAEWPSAGQDERLWLEQLALQVSWSTLQPAQAQDKAKAGN